MSESTSCCTRNLCFGLLFLFVTFTLETEKKQNEPEEHVQNLILWSHFSRLSSVASDGPWTPLRTPTTRTRRLWWSGWTVWKNVFLNQDKVDWMDSRAGRKVRLLSWPPPVWSSTTARERWWMSRADTSPVLTCLPPQVCFLLLPSPGFTVTGFFQTHDSVTDRSGEVDPNTAFF